MRLIRFEYCKRKSTLAVFFCKKIRERSNEWGLQIKGGYCIIEEEKDCALLRAEKRTKKDESIVSGGYLPS